MPKTVLRACITGLLFVTSVSAQATGFDSAIKNNSLALSPDGATAVVSNSDETNVLVYDLRSGKVAYKLSGFVTPRNIVFAPDGAKFYVSDSGTGQITVFETATAKPVGIIAAGPGAFGTVLSGDGARLYVNNQASSTVAVFDTATLRATTVITGFSQPRQGVRLSPDGKTLFVTNFLGDKITLVSVISRVSRSCVQSQSPRTARRYSQPIAAAIR